MHGARVTDGDPWAHVSGDALGGGDGDPSSVHAARGGCEGGKVRRRMRALSTLFAGIGAPTRTGWT